MEQARREARPDIRMTPAGGAIFHVKRTRPMQIHSELLNDNILKVTLEGRLDVEGTQAIDLKLTTLTATSHKAVLVDLSQVDFLASIGIRTLLTCAKTTSKRGGTMLLVNPQPMVRAVLDRSGVSSLIPVYADEETALGTLDGA
jgi:anti-sigma B factor antagonist